MRHRNVLIISEGPPPLGDTGVEGGALRAWGLSKGLASHGYKVCFAYRSTFQLAENAKNSPLPQGINIATWNGSTLPALLKENKIVIMRYAMGEAASIAGLLDKNHILVADCYIPIAVEVAARRSEQKDEDLNFLYLQESSKHTAQRADYILYASPAQKPYYDGYFAGINKLNPVTYDSLPERLFEVPYGIDKNEKPADMGKTSDEPVLLWYGAFYSWFDMEGLIESLMDLKKKVPNYKLLIAGAKNPYNKDPSIIAHYNKTVKSLEKLGTTVEYLPWTPFDKRFEIYKQASAIITWNHLGLENEYAWRTRLMDFVLAERPIITNGGDPLGEDLIERGIAFRSTTTDIAETFQSVIKHPPTTYEYEAVANHYDWSRITEKLAVSLQSPSRIPDSKMEISQSVISIVRRRFKTLLLSPYLFARSIKRYGISETLHKIKRRIRK